MKRYIKGSIGRLEDEDFYALCDIASDPNTPSDDLKELYENPRLRPFLASNPNLPIDLIRSLCKSSNYSVISGLAFNPNTPLEVLKAIFYRCGFHVRQEIVKHPNMDSSTLYDLIHSGRLAPGTCRLAKERLKAMK